MDLDPPTYDEEAALLEEGYAVIAGVDEAGRGSLAGPVIAAAAVLPVHPKGKWLLEIRDSKQLTPRRRLAALETMGEASVTVAIGSASAAEIDTKGIIEATRMAMTRAVAALPVMPQYLLIDAMILPDLDIPSTTHHQGRCEVPFDCGGVHCGEGYARFNDARSRWRIPGLRLRAAQRIRDAPAHRRT